MDFLAGIKNAVVYIKVSDGNSDCFSDLVELMCLDLSVYTDLSPLCENGIYETANSYIVSTSGLYKFKAYKGNSQELAGTAQTNHPSGKVSHVNVLWESFGTDVLPSKGDLIYSVGYKNEYVYFRVLDEFKEGNAVIAANDNLDRVLWSWHVWLTDYPKEQVYYNNAGTMMDRNLGATTDNPREPNVIGLKYQWGRKDPFGGGARTESTKTEKSMSIENAILNPMTYFQYSSNGTSGPLTTEILWNEDSNIKSIYDPCPAGWRVPNGGKDGVWAKALGQSASFKNEIYDSINRGVNFSSKLCDDLCVWYGEGSYWAADGTAKEYPSGFQISYQDIYPSGAGSHKVNANFVRCMKEQS